VPAERHEHAELTEFIADTGRAVEVLTASRMHEVNRLRNDLYVSFAHRIPVVLQARCNATSGNGLFCGVSGKKCCVLRCD
jgi:hypothetical protein